jgi:hypothetical protein
MELRLFKEPYHEPFSKGRLRLLFETAGERGGDRNYLLDFYLYVWIQDGRSLAGFQAVFEEEYICDFRPPSRLEFGKIGPRPVKRSVKGALSPAEKEAFLAVMTGLSNPLFPHLVRRIDEIAHGAHPGRVELTDDETATLDRLERDAQAR